MDPEGGLPDVIEESHQVAYGSFRTTHQSSGVRHLLWLRRQRGEIFIQPTHIPCVDNTRSGYGIYKVLFVVLVYERRTN
ncbi:hypothetical protein PpBr36_00930 [Pyricularia pennisetigena]|uniref:hypothetical protein n=1 Tax=Pyricularia pennisetigena TaxID=1578925 RepID=UPI00114FB705|nr:hypothetical protein PpBr36_00930 [Pyricularia pennisetigena]TLS28158.1 hypothetical protein PpBr36_00930 [Pyricularia pennisetigena]